LLDYPWLVRLNPAVPWKTRGNGAVCFFMQVDGLSEARRVVGVVGRVAAGYGSGGGKAGYVAVFDDRVDSIDEFQSMHPLLSVLYSAAVSRQVWVGEALELLDRLGGLVLHRPRGGVRGVVGALASLGAALWYDHTFELLVYRRRSFWGRPRLVDAGSVVDFDVRFRPYTFLNYDYASGRVLVAPHGPDPVLYGVRGEYPEPLVEALEVISSEEPDFAVMYRSNQATDDHLRRVLDPGRVRVYDCGVVYGFVEGVRVIAGGHMVVTLSSGGVTFYASVYRETGLVGVLGGLLRRGVGVVAAGCFKEHRGRLTLNVEKICVDAVGAGVLKPRCPVCGGVLSSKGRGAGYRCSACGRVWPDLSPVYLVGSARGVCFTAAPSALHHLTMPCCRLGLTSRPRRLRPPSTPILFE